MTNLPEIEIDLDPNPLSAFFRQPGLHVSIPTGGAFLPKGGLVLEANGEVPVLPMVPSDEILLKNPDALLSGQAIKNLIRSCVPSFKVVNEISMPDLDVLLLAIRAATYGENMDMEVQCEKCQESANYECNLPSILSTVSPIPPDIEVVISPQITVHLKPFSIEVAQKSEMITFDQYRRIQAVEGDAYTDEERAAAKDDVFNVLSAARIEAIAGSVMRIDVPKAKVTNRKHILEFLQKSNATILSRIEDKLGEINEMGMDKTIEIVCANEDCKHSWKTKIEFNPATFFDRGSSV